MTEIALTPMEQAERNKQRVIDNESGHIKAILGDLAPIIQSKQSLQGRLFRLIQVTDRLMEHVIPYTPCGNGCSHCCHQAISISQVEAERISRFTKRKLRNAEKIKNVEANRAKYTGVACPFLKEGKCSVYEVRPFICRLHHNITDDSEICDTKTRPGEKVPALNFNNTIVGAYSLLVSKHRYADIRSWFA